MGKKRMRSATPTLGSKTARDGFKVEKIIEHRVVQQKIIEYLQLQAPEAQSIFPIYPHGKKTDVFLAPWNIKFQIKKIADMEKDRGHHVDRRSIDKFTSFFNQELKNDFCKFMVDRQMTRSEKDDLCKRLQQQKEAWMNFLTQVIQGNEPPFAPDYFLIVETKNITKGKLHLLCVHTLIGHLLKTLRIQIKETCIHLTPCMYLQRRGGDASDSRPNDIQTKLVLQTELMKLSTYLGEYDLS